MCANLVHTRRRRDFKVQLGAFSRWPLPKFAELEQVHESDD